MKLKMKSKPKMMTLQEVYELYRMDSGEETSEFVVKVLDLCYPELDREDMNVFEKMNKYREAKLYYTNFHGLIEDMVGNGIS